MVIYIYIDKINIKVIGVLYSCIWNHPAPCTCEAGQLIIYINIYYRCVHVVSV